MRNEANAWIGMGVLAAVLACGTASDGGAAEDTTGGSSTGPGDIDTDGNSGAMSSATTGPAPGTTASATTGVGDTTSAADVDSGGGMESFGFITAATEGGPGMQPNGADCSADEDCDSGYCYSFQQGGVCSECIMDADCEMGTCSFGFNTGFAVCTDGGLGVSCDSDRGCMGDYVCATVLVTGGGNSIDHCSECDADSPCADGEVCSPVLEGSFFESYLGCVTPGSVDLGGGCPLDDQGVGDGTVCMSGQCGIATFGMGNFQLGICSECDADDDCTPPATCTAPTSMMGMVTPGSCQ